MFAKNKHYAIIPQVLISSSVINARILHICCIHVSAHLNAVALDCCKLQRLLVTYFAFSHSSTSLITTSKNTNFSVCLKLLPEVTMKASASIVLIFSVLLDAETLIKLAFPYSYIWYKYILHLCIWIYIFFFFIAL